MKLRTKWSNIATAFLLTFIIFIIGVIIPEFRVPSILIVAFIPLIMRLFGYPLFELK